MSLPWMPAIELLYQVCDQASKRSKDQSVVVHFWWTTLLYMLVVRDSDVTVGITMRMILVHGFCRHIELYGNQERCMHQE